jgi:putative endonuclease
MQRKETGNYGERLARDYLKKHGFRILETNFTCRYGEIDIISTKDKTLVFTEVRTKTGDEYGTPEESITPLKQSRLRKSAVYYVQHHRKLPEFWRIDVVAIELNPDGSVKRLDLYENAVGEG